LLSLTRSAGHAAYRDCAPLLFLSTSFALLKRKRRGPLGSTCSTVAQSAAWCRHCTSTANREHFGMYMHRLCGFEISLVVQYSFFHYPLYCTASRISRRCLLFFPHVHVTTSYKLTPLGLLKLQQGLHPLAICNLQRHEEPIKALLSASKSGNGPNPSFKVRATITMGRVKLVAESTPSLYRSR
jgi:hypothetical protein